MGAQRTGLFLAITFFLLALWLALAGLPVSAQGIIIDPPPLVEPPASMGPIGIEEHRVAVVIDGPLAQVRVTQVFHNDTHQTIEGVYLFPLPGDAAVSDFQMTVDGQVLEGKLLDRDEARRIYEEIVRSRRDPALLEYIGRNLFQTSVFPIPAGESRKLELNYTQIVAQRNGLYEFVYPLRTRQYGAAPVKRLALSIELRNQPGLRTLYSPHYDVSIDRRGDDQALIGYEASHTQPEHDFALYFGAAHNEIGLNLLSYKPAGEDGFFVLLAAPSIEVEEQAVVARDIVLALDVSGSMQGDKIEQARNAAHFVVDQLNPGDRFNLISFSTGVRLWQGELQPADEPARKAAHAWINRLTAAGSTDINRALLEALGQLQVKQVNQHPGYILFLTDGLPTQGETEVERILANAQNNKPEQTSLRLFTFGVGYDVNTDLLDTLSQELGGRSNYVRPDEAIDEEVSQFYSGISTPVLVDTALSFGQNVVVDETYPYPLPDLFAGDQLVLVGRYAKGGQATVTLRGVANGQKMSFQYPGQTLVQSGGEPFVARLWATRKIGALLEQVRRSGPDQELIDEIVNLSLTYGIVTPYTSYLVVEPEIVEAGAAPASEPVVGLREKAEDEVAEYAAQSAAAAPSGEAAVVASEARAALSDADMVHESTGVRYVNGKSFVRQAILQTAQGEALELWVDTLYHERMALETVFFGSPRYFALARQPHLTPWLAVSPELILVLDEGHAVRVTVAPP
jgi:Ca-activated chloride channel family protein